MANHRLNLPRYEEREINAFDILKILLHITLLVLFAFISFAYKNPQYPWLRYAYGTLYLGGYLFTWLNRLRQQGI